MRSIQLHITIFILEHLRVNYICNIFFGRIKIIFFEQRLFCPYMHIVGVSTSRECNIDLTMSPYMLGQ